MKNKVIYCVFCGTENNSYDKKCIKCKKKLNPKENSFLEYLKDHIKDDLKGKTEDKVFSIVKNFIKSHLYGTILTISIIITSSVIVVNNINQVRYEEVFDKPTITSNYLGEGLTARELALKYLSLLKDGQEELAKTFIASDDFYGNHDLGKNINFFRNNYLETNIRYIKEYGNVAVFLENDSNSIAVEYLYCREEVCTDETNNISFVFMIETVEIDGNWYIYNDVIDFLDDDFDIGRSLLNQTNNNVEEMIDLFYN